MRYNIFYKIHKGLRVMLYETATGLQLTDFNAEHEAETAMKSITAVVDMFDKHAHLEDTLVFPAIAQYEESVVDVFSQEHVLDHELTEKLRTFVLMFNSLETDVEKKQMGSAIRKAFVEFLVFNLNHMAKEEDILNNLLWHYLSDAEIIAIEHNIVSRQSPAESAAGMKWMLRGLSNEEIISWMKGIQKNAPEFVFNNLFELAEKELPATRFRKVVEGLTEGVMLA